MGTFLLARKSGTIYSANSAEFDYQVLMLNRFLSDMRLGGIELKRVSLRIGRKAKFVGTGRS